MIATGIEPSSKVYNGTTAAVLTTAGASLSGVLAGDIANVTLNPVGATGSFSSAAVGTGTTVTVSGLTISGTASGNYSLAQPTTTANITAAPLPWSFSSADSRRGTT